MGKPQLIKAKANAQSSRYPRSLKMRNNGTPYVESEVKATSRIDFVIRDDRKRSPLGKSITFAQIDDIQFASILKALGVTP